MEAQVRNFIVDELQWSGAPQQLTDDYPLIENDVLDSMGIYEMVGFLESTYGVEIDDEDLVPDNFATIRAITQLVTEKSGSRA